MAHGTRRTGFALFLTFLAFLANPSLASADTLIGSVGSGAGQYQGPRGIAVDSSNGRLVLADSGNNRIDVFKSDGSFLFAFGWKVNASVPEEKLQTCTMATGCLSGTAGAGTGQLDNPEQVAVDGASHAVYVTEGEANLRLQKFDSEGHFVWAAGGEVDLVTHADLCTAASGHPCGPGKEGGAEGLFLKSLEDGLPIAIGTGEIVYVADSEKIGTAESEGFNTRLQRFEANGAHVGPQLILPGAVGRISSAGVDAFGEIYTVTAAQPALGPASGGLHKYHPDGTPYGDPFPPPVSIGGVALARSPAGELLVGRFEKILAFNSAGAQTRIFFPALLNSNPRGLAFFHSSVDVLFATGENSLLRIDVPPPGPLFVPASVKACPAVSVSATLCATFNPEGKPSTAHFQYVDKHSFDTEGGFASPNTQTTPESEPTPGGFENQTAKATNTCVVPTEASCLKPETTYYFRAFAKNADGEVEGEKAEFTTKPTHEVGDLWTTDVGTDSARLHAEVNPLGIEATAHFQYIAEGADYQEHGFEHAADSPALHIGSGEALLSRSTQLSSLTPGTTYHYRLVVEDPYFAPIVSTQATFETFALPGAGEAGSCPNEAFRTGPSASLPDCRAYELVTPLDKDNGDVLTRINITGYPTNLDQSSLDGSSFAYTSYRAFADPESAPYTNQYLAHRGGGGWSTENLVPPRSGHFRSGEVENEYQAFSPDLSKGWLLQEGEPTLDPCAAKGVSGLYRRDILTASYQALSCAPVGQIAKEHISPLATEYMPEFQGASADGSKALIRIDDALTPDASGALLEGARPIYQTYETLPGGALRLISVLPNGEAAAVDSSAGTALIDSIANHNRFSSVFNAISADGTRVFWTAGTALGQVYLRLNSDQAPSKVVAGKCTQPTRACTIPVSGTVTAEGAFFHAANPQGTEALFTVRKGPLAGNLYRFDASAEPPTSTLIAEGVRESILGSSEDLSHIYFASTVATAQEQSEGAIPGEPNVYLYEEGATRFVATLSSPKTASPYSDTDNPFGTPIAAEPILRTARVSPDGQSLVFMSNSPALAQDTASYDNTDVSSGREDFEVYLYDAQAQANRLHCVSCNPSGVRPAGREIEKSTNKKAGPFAAATIPRFQSQLYQPRYLTDDGERVFFNSFEALALGDTNGKQDVYQWEALGSGNCSASSPGFVPSSGGCLSLVSSGQSPDGSEFLDASPSGVDVFLTTVEGLLPQDYGLIDVYDARVNGGFPPPPNPPAACEGEACQGTPQAPNDPTPASAATVGAGNVVEPKPRKRKKHRKAHKRHQRANRNGRNHR